MKNMNRQIIGNLCINWDRHSYCHKNQIGLDLGDHSELWEKQELDWVSYLYLRRHTKKLLADHKLLHETNGVFCWFKFEDCQANLMSISCIKLEKGLDMFNIFHEWCMLIRDLNVKESELIFLWNKDEKVC